MLNEEQVTSVTAELRRVFARRVVDPHQLDDVVQETLTRIIQAEPGLDGDELAAYAVVTARNTLIGWARRARELPGAVEDDVATSGDPVGAALQAEERLAVRDALAALPEHDRSVLVAHEVEGATTNDIAVATRSTAGAVATRLARVRARARVDYVVALRNVTCPPPAATTSSSRCRRATIDASARSVLPIISWRVRCAPNWRRP